VATSQVWLTPELPVLHYGRDFWEGQGFFADYNAFHKELNKVWRQAHMELIPGSRYLSEVDTTR